MAKQFLVPNITQLKALDANDVFNPRMALLAGYSAAGDGDPALWLFLPGDVSAQVAGDPNEAIWAAPVTDPSGSSGGWKRQLFYPTEPAVAYATLAALEADLSPASGTPALVTNDPTPANNGWYRKSGSPGVGSWIQSSYDRVAVVESSLAAVETLLGGAAATAITLIAWVSGLALAFPAVTRDGYGNILTATVEWPDNSAGTYTATNFNPLHNVYDGFTVTHTDSSQTVTQAAVTRDAAGLVTAQPVLVVA